ncbi:ATP-dependent DNA helicase chl1 [Tilletia horrida]|uniref:ATP-dependent DNA helicase CHL1 n=1 Tax=Tilletia horrida TaxID=155126 RepID=A0AAN6JQC0_9BASI|nr:ATP-dependent DNA helicase chl1 [Tilletia horrida]KAK0565580.1 ATP-dependent DNA helicase chl1 [Tilletia horrida]
MYDGMTDAEGSGLTLSQPERTGPAYRFPYPVPYSNQLDLMSSLFEAIEHRKVAVMESPTGTGKSLSVICGALTWLTLDAQRSRLGTLLPNSGGADAEADGEPDWVTAHAEARQKASLTQHETELNHRISAIRSKYAQLKAESAQKHRRSEQSARPRKKIVSKVRIFEAAQTTLTRITHSQRLDGELDSDEDESKFLPSDCSDSESIASSSTAKNRQKQMNARFRVLPYTDRISSESGPQQGEDDISLAPEVRALIAELAASRPQAARSSDFDAAIDEEPIKTPKVYFASRTHSQLSQFVSELRKTAFAGPEPGTEADLKWTNLHTERDRSLRITPLGSRRQLCIHPGVQKLGDRRGTEAMNEKCLELMKGKKTKTEDEDGTSKKGKCQFLPSNDPLGHAQMLDFRDHALATVHDIEDLAELGRELHICPYYGARAAARQAELITLPYPLLLSRASRQAMALSLTDSVVIIDEAHNLIDTILSSQSLSLSYHHLRSAKAGLDVYLARFSSRLKGTNEIGTRRVRAVVGALEEWSSKELERARKGDVAKERILTTNELLSLVGSTFDQVNFLTLQSYLQESQLLRKVISYIDHQVQQAAAKAAATSSTSRLVDKRSQEKNSRRMKTAMQTKEGESEDRRDDRTATMAAMMSGMYAIEGFLLALTNRNDDGRVFVSISPEKDAMTLRYQLLNPADSFGELVKEARSVILLGGTMEPMSDFRVQLFPQVPASRFTTFSCGHIIPPSNLHATVLTTGPPRVNRPFEFKWDARSDMGLLDDLGTTLLNIANVVPRGMVVFVPSYSFLESIWKRWEDSGLLGKLGLKKQIFQEPKSSGDVESVFERYAAAVAEAGDKGISAAGNRMTGAIMFAVVGAKLSEGINFSDDLARAVVMVGMPFANAASPELAERMRYVRDLAKTSTLATPSKLDAGQELYLNMCMKAVNQSIGRAIRHKDDYAALILLDRRYARADIRQRLPGWIRNEVKTVESFGQHLAALASFFRGKRQ